MNKCHVYNEFLKLEDTVLFNDLDAHDKFFDSDVDAHINPHTKLDVAAIAVRSSTRDLIKLYNG